MTESFHSEKSISKETFRDLIKRNNHPALTRFLVLVAMTFFSFLMVVFGWNLGWLARIGSLIFFGIICCSNFAGLHESAHGTAFKSKKLNQFAAFFCGIAHIYPSTIFKELHFTHHRYTNIPGKDPEISLGNKPAPAILGSLPMYLGWITGLPFLLYKINMMIVAIFGMPEFLRKNLFLFIRSKIRVKIFLESLLILSFYGAIIFIAIQFDPRFWGIIFGQMVGHFFLAKYLVLEHNGLPHEGNIFEKTRSINTSKIIKLVMWNMPYHAEHHAFPAVPFHQLPKLKDALGEELLHKEEGTVEFHRRVIKEMLQ